MCTDFSLSLSLSLSLDSFRCCSCSRLLVLFTLEKSSRTHAVCVLCLYVSFTPALTLNPHQTYFSSSSFLFLFSLSFILFHYFARHTTWYLLALDTFFHQTVSTDHLRRHVSVWQEEKRCRNNTQTHSSIDSLLHWWHEATTETTLLTLDLCSALFAHITGLLVDPGTFAFSTCT